MSQNGKGDSPRNCFSQQYRDNYDDIFRKKDKKTVLEQEDTVEESVNDSQKSLETEVK